MPNTPNAPELIPSAPFERVNLPDLYAERYGLEFAALVRVDDYAAEHNL